MFQFNKATRKQAKARIALAGPSGSGKTTDALVIATILAGGTTHLGPIGYETDMSSATTRIAVIDTERGSASLYADQFDFDVLEFPAPFSPARLSAAIKAATDAGYGCIVIDGLTPFWNGEGGVLEIVDAAGRGNSYTGWKEGTPAQQLLVSSMVNASAHIIATVRSKTEYVLVQNAKGKMEPKKMGMAPEQRAGLEYEFTVVADVDLDHQVVASKTRCPLLADRLFRKEQVTLLAETFLGWLNSGDVIKSAAETDKARIRELGALLGLDEVKLLGGLSYYASAQSWEALTADGAGRVVTALEKKAIEAGLINGDGTPAAEAAAEPAEAVASFLDTPDEALGDYTPAAGA